MKKSIALAIASILALTLAACGSSSGSESSVSGSSDSSNNSAASSEDGKVYTLKWAHSSPADDRIGLAVEKMKAELEEASGGRIHVEHYPASQLGGEREILESMQLGVGSVDCAIISTGVVVNFSPSVAVTSMPYLIDSYDVGKQVYGSEFGRLLGETTEKEAGWKFLAWGENSLRMFSNSKREIQTPADMAGLKIRTMENDIHMQIVRDLGASPTPVSFAELFTALQQGTVDGQENGPAPTYTNNFYEVVKYMTYFPHIYDPYIVCISTNTWNSLPPDLQELVAEYGVKVAQYEMEFNEAQDEEYLQVMQDEGLKVYYPTDEQKQLFIDATSDVEGMIRDKVGDELVDSYKSTVADITK